LWIPFSSNQVNVQVPGSVETGDPAAGDLVQLQFYPNAAQTIYTAAGE